MAKEIRAVNATTLFLIPLFNIKRDKLIMHGFESAYIKDEMREIEYKNAIFLLFRPFKSVDAFNEFVEQERKRGAPIIDEYDYVDGWTVLVYQYADKWEEDVSIIMDGKFSKVSDRFKKMIPATVEEIVNGYRKEKASIQHQIFNKTPYIKEYWKKTLDIDIEDCEEHWEYYPSREILTETALKKLK